MAGSLRVVLDSLINLKMENRTKLLHEERAHGLLVAGGPVFNTLTFKF
jgi:hypothetical protein